MALTTYNITGNLEDALGAKALLGEVTFMPAGTTEDARVDGADAMLGPIRYSIADLPSPMALTEGAWVIAIRPTGRVNGEAQFRTKTIPWNMTAATTWGAIVASAADPVPLPAPTFDESVAGVLGTGGQTDTALRETFARRKRGVLGSVGAVCFTWDDGYASHDTIRQMADSRGQRHTFAITSGLLGQTNRMTNAQVLAAYQKGHEISSHTVTHAAISDITLAERVAEYDNSKTALEAIIGVGKVKTFTYTYGSHKRTATTDKELHLRYDRVLNTGSESGDSGSPYIYSRDELRPGATPWLIGRFPWTAANHQRVLALIRQAAVQPIVVVLYAHDPGAGVDPSMAQVTEAMDLVQSLGIDALTTEEAFPAQSIVADPGFEDPTLASWLVSKSAGGASNVAESIVDTPAAGLNGSRSLHLTQNDAGGAGFTYVAQQVPVTPGVSYTLSFKYRSNTSGASFTRPRARTRDYVGNIITQNQANLNNVQATWADGSLVFTADATAVSVSLEFIININTGEAWFDHVHFGPTRLGVLG